MPSRWMVSLGCSARKSPVFHFSVAVTDPDVRVTEPALTLAAAGPANRSVAPRVSARMMDRIGRPYSRGRSFASPRSGGRGGARVAGRSGRGGSGLVLGLGGLGALLGPRLVELDAPLALLVLHQRELGAERAAAAAL